MNHIVILSPHFDDSILSCGGYLWQARQAGFRVRVISIFAGPPPIPIPPFALVQHIKWGNPPEPNRLRRAEDIAAHIRLGCFDLYHLHAADAVYRLSKEGNPLYGSEEKIFGNVHPEEQEYARVLADIISAYLPAESTIFAPLGIGHHVDHLLGYAIGEHLLQDGWEVAFYEELPYVERENFSFAPQIDKSLWQAEQLFFSEEALAAKVEALAYYRTQISVLYGDELSMAERVRTTAQLTAADGFLQEKRYAERVWRKKEKTEAVSSSFQKPDGS